MVGLDAVGSDIVIETPAFVVDMKKVKKNIEIFQNYGDSLGLAVRPHIKTHKMPELAKLQIAQGAVGITCAKISEAEVMMDHGLTDIFIAYPIIGDSKLERLLNLCERGRIIATVDSRAGAAMLSEAACRRGVEVETRIEIDTGMRRAGVQMDEAVDLALFVSALPNIKLTGIFTYKASNYEKQPTNDNLSAAKEESILMGEVAAKIRGAGVPLKDVSGGSSATAEFSRVCEGLTEIRPGAYVFGDMMRVQSGAISVPECAAVVRATVISTPTKDRAVIDGGSKVFAGDIKTGVEPLFLEGCGHVAGRDDLLFARMSEEHGVLEAKNGETGLTVGQIVDVVPNHCCSTLNLFNFVYLIDEDGTVRKETVLARGMIY